MEYQQLVISAKQAVAGLKQHRERLIMLTLEAIDVHGKTQQQWADDIGVSAQTAGRWYNFGHDQHADGGKTYQEWREEQPSHGASYADVVERGTRNLPAEQKAEVVRQWLADDDGGQTRAEVGRVLHQHDTDTEQHLSHVRQARANEGDRPDFETTESVQRVLADYAALEADSARLPATLSGRSASLIAYRASHALPTVQYHANLEHEHGLSDEELAQLFGDQS